MIVTFAGIIVSASENTAAAARDRHASGAAGEGLHYTRDGARVAVNRSIRDAARRSAGRVVRRDARDGAHGGADQPGTHAQSSAPPVRHPEPSPESGYSFRGMASYYSEGQHLASGATYAPSGYTCAHPTLPFGTRLRVADPKSGRSVVVTVNDRGPFVRGRALDVSLGAARALGMIGPGVMRVEAHVI
jgi:rare lipoprotein A